MKFLTTAATTTALLLAVTASLADAFVGRQGFVSKTPTRTSSRSALNMVAEDAKVILVTGSSRGLGKSIALEMGRMGQKVVINYVSANSKDVADKAVEEVKALGGDAIAVQADSTYISIQLIVIALLDPRPIGSILHSHSLSTTTLHSFRPGLDQGHV